MVLVLGDMGMLTPWQSARDLRALLGMPEVTFAAPPSPTNDTAAKPRGRRGRPKKTAPEA